MIFDPTKKALINLEQYLFNQFEMIRGSDVVNILHSYSQQVPNLLRKTLKTVLKDKNKPFPFIIIGTIMFERRKNARAMLG